MPISLYEKLKGEAGKAGRSVNAELVGRLERTLNESSNELDTRIIFDALERLSARNPELIYSFAVNLGVQIENRPAEIKGSSWTLAVNPLSDISEDIPAKA